MSKEEIENLVEKTIEEMGLEHCADNKIGNWYFRGISGGEKKRLSIGLEILTQPQIMLLDEPTTGLDSASAFFVVCTLGNIAHNGRIVVCSIHQPSGYLFDLFDDLYLLSGGEAVYFGDAKLAVKEEVIVLSNKSKSSWWKQMYTLTDRSFVNMRRDVGYYWLRMVFYLGVAVCTGIIYYNINTSYLDIIARAKCQAFVYGFMICLSNGGLPSFIEEIKVYNGEMLKNHYGASVVMISNFISSFPFLLVTAISTGTIIYEMVKLHPGFSHYSYFVLNLFCCLSVIETLMMLVAFMVPNVLMGIGLGTGLIVFMMMASEIFRPICDLPKFFWRYPMSYISFASWALQGVFKNDMIGIEFDPLVAGEPKLKGTMDLLY
uniref:ABC transporter G family member 15 n=1 Tax=Cannabis sativa TaxID=3483 RepID=A0A803P6W7_CANSA